MPPPDLKSFWKPSFETLYDACFYELSSEALIRRWRTIDMTTAIAVALFTSGSAISGWALWNNPDGRLVWAMLAGFASVLSIIHGTLGVPGKIKEEEDRRSLFSALRVDLESFRQRLIIVGDGAAAEEQFTALRRRLSDYESKTPADIAFRRKVREQVQEEVNHRLKKYIQQ